MPATKEDGVHGVVRRRRPRVPSPLRRVDLPPRKAMAAFVCAGVRGVRADQGRAGGRLHSTFHDLRRLPGSLSSPQLHCCWAPLHLLPFPSVLTVLPASCSCRHCQEENMRDMSPTASTHTHVKIIYSVIASTFTILLVFINVFLFSFFLGKEE
jgi:hypothetical protein